MKNAEANLEAIFASRKELHKSHPVYPILEKKRLLIIESSPIVPFIFEEASVNQKMNVSASLSRPIDNYTPVSIDEYMNTHAIDFLLIHPWKEILPEIQRTIDDNHHVILITSPFSIDKKSVMAMKTWGKQGIPLVSKYNLSELPEKSMKIMAEILNEEH